MNTLFSIAEDFVNLFYLDEKFLELDKSGANLSVIIAHLMAFFNYRGDDIEKFIDEEFDKTNIPVSDRIRPYCLSKSLRYKKEMFNMKKEHSLREGLLDYLLSIYRSYEGHIVFGASVISYLEWKKMHFSIVKIKNEEWDEDLSTKIISSILPENIKLPYTAFFIDTSNYDWKFLGEKVKEIFVKQDSSHLELIVLKDCEVNNVHYASLLNKQPIGECDIVKQYPETLFIINKIIGIIMYMETFKNDKNRLSISLKKNKNKSNRNKKDTSLIRTIRLSQPEISINYSKDKGFDRKKPSASFVVRGHWRNQSFVNEEKVRFNRPIWIDPFVKGTNKNAFERVVKI